MAIVMDTHTGAVPAMASLGQTPTAAGRAGTGQRRAYDRVRARLGEQADHHLGRPAERGDQADHGVGHPRPYRVAGHLPDDATHPIEHWTVTDILANSSNIGTIMIARRLGKTDLIDYIHSYGLGSVTDLHFPGESAGLLPDRHWSGTSIANVPIGQGIAVTAIQMLAAYNTIANGGVYVAPRSWSTPPSTPRATAPRLPPSPAHRVVSPTVARGDDDHAERGGPVRYRDAAAIDGYTVAGKTGTACMSLAGRRLRERRLRRQLRRVRAGRRTRRSPAWWS